MSIDNKISPSEFMRELRPEYYSDTEDHVSYQLDRTELEYYLETITARNQTNSFEMFCRKLCERAICPNLRPQTGPEGGGDSKADSETFIVAEEIFSLTYIGTPNAGNERWAFAFSAMKRWSVKVRNDVIGIVQTKRPYDRIIFVTSQFARSKDRARIEDELSKEYGIPVTIHDRSWIITEIIEKDRKDIAFNYLNIGNQMSDPLRLGPIDYSRARQLDEIEKSIQNSEYFIGSEQQKVTDSLIAAKLSRNMERPRIETEGRFQRAVRLAEAHGTFRQKLEAKYEQIWTAFWWFDDILFLRENYDSFEKSALTSENTIDLEFLCNLHQLLINCVVHNLLSQDESQLNKRTEKLETVLKGIINQIGRPNNSLEAELSLLIIQLNKKVLKNNINNFSDIWGGFSLVLDKAKGLGEFNHNRLIKFIEISGLPAGNDPEYNSLVEKMASFVSNRKSEAEGALILLRRAQQLDFNNHFDMIRLLGKATVALSKKEYTEHFDEALQLLTLAYKSAGLRWAAHTSCSMLAAAIVIEGEEAGQLPVRFVPVMKVWAWVALEMWHLPNFLFAIQMLNGALKSLPLADESINIIREDISDLDITLANLMLNLDKHQLVYFEIIPDILESLGLFASRAALLYVLGHKKILEADGSIPTNETDEEINLSFSIIASQPFYKSVGKLPILYTEDQQILRTNILGMTVEINLKSTLKSIMVAEASLASLDAFFATMLDQQRVFPHTEIIKINIVESGEIDKPTFGLNQMEMTGTIIWPTSLTVGDFDKQTLIHRFFTELAGQILASSCMIDDINELLQKLYDDEAVYNRLTIAIASSNSFNRVTTRNILRVSDWVKPTQKNYTLCPNRPVLQRIQLGKQFTEDFERRPTETNNHQKYTIKSVIDIHAWDQAKWAGVAFGLFTPTNPPFLAFMFKNEDAARSIFKNWKKRFGIYDKSEDISLTIIREIPQISQHHYCVLITPNLSDNEENIQSGAIGMVTRSKLMEPNDSTNLSNFLELYENFGSFYLMPAILQETGIPKMLPDLAIIKRKLAIRLAKDIRKNDFEAMILDKI